MAGEILTWALGIHGVVLPFSLFGLYRYSDRTELFTKTVGDTDDLLDRMRGTVAAGLEEELRPVFERSDGEPLIVTPKQYTERPTNPVGSEAYREALRRFVDGKAQVLVDYVRTHKARRVWCSWARMLSWIVLILAFWQVLCLAGLGLVGKLFAVEIADWAVKWSFGPTVVLVGLFFVCQGVMLRQHDVIHDSKSRHYNL